MGFHQNWSLAESVQSSTWRELKAVCLTLEAFASPLSDSKVIWYSDKQNVESILLNGSKKSDFQELDLQAFKFVSSIAYLSMLSGFRGIGLRQPIPSASLLILLIMFSVMLFFRKLIAFGARMLLIGSRVTGSTCPIFRDCLSKEKPAIPFLVPAPLVLTLSLFVWTSVIPGPLRV